MEIEKQKRGFARWFRAKKPGCCNVKIEEIKDEHQDYAKEEKSTEMDSPGKRKERDGSCCG